MQNSLIIVLLLVLSACATDGPVVKVVTQKVEVPIAMPCQVNIPIPPELNFPKLQQSQSIFDKSKALLADRELQLGYETELLAALQSCVK